MVRTILLISLVCAAGVGHAFADGALRGVLDEVSNSGDSAICDSVQQYSGYFNLTTGDKHYFYWFFESRGDPANDPVILWLTGGPGCSSEVALFGENGPCKVNEEGTNTTLNPYSWNANANLLYVDQPTGTGFSYGLGLDHNEKGVATDMYDFLQQFFKAHPNYAKLDFYAVGESYAGHYIPAVTHKVWSMNKNLPEGGVHINLRGTGVGNGLVDPAVQYNYYWQMAASTNGHSPLSNRTVQSMKKATPGCVDLVNACQTNASACLVATELCNLGLLIPYEFSGLNPYDMRIKCAKPPLCYDFSNVGKYLDRPEVRAALGVGSRKWSDCNHLVAVAFELSGDWMRDFQTMIPDQLADGIRVLIYAGDQDFICNWLGNQAWARALQWDHKSEFNKAPVTNWTAGGSPAGTLQTSNGFSFLRVFSAGHMVPRDQPANAQEMINQFISGKL
eukprot:g3566.t1